MLHGLLAHALAEAMLSAPGMLGSLDLLFNPTGLLQSLGQAWGSLLLGPLAAIEARSPSQVCTPHVHPPCAALSHVNGRILMNEGFIANCDRSLQLNV